jgi:hypothetical protein
MFALEMLLAYMLRAEESLTLDTERALFHQRRKLFFYTH